MHVEGVQTIAVCMVIITAAAFVTAAALVWAILAFKSMVSKKVDEAMSKIQPVVDQAKSIADQAKETTDKLSASIDAIASKAEETADTVGDKVKAVSEKVEGAVNPQIVTIAGIVGTAAKCAQIYHDVVKFREEGNGSRGGKEA